MADADLDISLMSSFMPSDGKITSECLKVKCARRANNNVDDSVKYKMTKPRLSN